jgi:cation diffusion facilitator family transporter
MSSLHHHTEAPMATSSANERRTRIVVLLTLTMMLVEITAGIAFQSMALLADGWHMATHAGALGIALFAYRFARTHAQNPRFTHGTDKVNALGGFSSAVVLGIVALLVAAESCMRLYSPTRINFDEAILVAIIGLLVNLVSAWLLRDTSHAHHHHTHDHDHEHDHHHHHDHNLRAAYMHVIADALTSVLAITALVVGKYLGWVWMDPLMGIIGSIVIAHWSRGLLIQTGRVLLDYN